MTYSLVGNAPGNDSTLSFAAHYALVNIIKNFATGQLGIDSYSGAGNGKIKSLAMLAVAAPEETWTITATSATTFSVTGSTSGSQAAATVDTLYDNGIIQFILVAGAVDFVASDSFVLSATNGVRTLYKESYSGVGNGIVSHMVLLDKLTETWTLVCTSASADGGTFSVTGSVSGAQAVATVGAAYDNGEVQFLINDGTTDFAVNDTFVLQANHQELPELDRWVVERWDDTTDVLELIMRGPGIPGIGSVYVGFRTKQEVAGDYYNIVVSTMEAYIESNSYDTQTKVEHRTLPAWQFDIGYRLRVSPRQIWCQVDIEGNDDIMGAGFYLSYYKPGQYPYPSFVSGSLGSYSATRYDNTTRHWGLEDDYFKVLWLDGSYIQPNLTWQHAWWEADNTIEPTRSTEMIDYTGTGDGEMSRISRLYDSPNETWTITATSATNFTVSGSVSGAQADATVGTEYSNGVLRFIIEAGATAFVSGDIFLVQTSVVYSIDPLIFTDSSRGNLGEFEGVGWITGFANERGNLVVDDDDETHYVFRDVHRTGLRSYSTLILD